MTALSITNLHKRYKGGFHALKGIDLRVEEGDFFALLGPNGAGKSTAIGIICSLVNKTSGKISVFGDDLDTDPIAVKRHIGLVPQEYNFNHWEPVAEILVNQAGYQGIPRALAWRRTEKLLRQLKLWDKRTVMARNLSGGMKRRLMIARALVHKPRLLILDEPTAGVDIEIRLSMWKFLRQLNEQGTTIILTTHYLEEAENLCRNIAIIHHGEIVEQSPMNSLLAKFHQQTFVLNLQQPLEALPQFDGFHLLQRDATTIEVTVRQGQGLTDLFCRLAESKLEVLSMRNKQNRLEQLFLELTSGDGEQQ
ncbi:MAG: ABC transporter ATP-binding protein [Pseudomonadota bacterium]|nr:ABC transporter ATP-binding protein [Pseudomonadota bacterium]